MMTPGQVLELARCARMVPITLDDRVEFGRALVLQGYSPARAVELATTIEDNDGAIQMLARHRVRYSTGGNHG